MGRVIAFRAVRDKHGCGRGRKRVNHPVRCTDLEDTENTEGGGRITTKHAKYW